MPGIALLRPNGFCTLTKAMTYIRSSTPDFSTPLSREELRVFTAIRGETSFDAVVVKTGLDHELIEDVIANLIARGLIVPSGNVPQPPKPVVASQPATHLATHWSEQRGAVERFLRSRVGGSKAETYITQLQNCASEEVFVENTRSIARRLALIVDASVGEQLLALLDD